MSGNAERIYDGPDTQHIPSSICDDTHKEAEYAMTHIIYSLHLSIMRAHMQTYRYYNRRTYDMHVV